MSSGLFLGTISFPGLGWTFEIDRVAFSIGRFDIYWYAVFIVGAMILSAILGLNQCKKYGISSDDVIDNVLFAIPSAVVGARLYYVIFEWESIKRATLTETIASVLNIRDGGLAIYGGLIGAALAVFFVARHKKLKFLHLFDFAVPYIAISQGIGRWGNFVNQEAFGVNTTLPWGMTGDEIVRTLTYKQAELAELGMTVDPNGLVHPTFFYESVCNIAIGIFLFVMRDKFMSKKEGYNTFMYLSLYGLCRAFIEGLRTDSLYIGPIRVSQLLALVCFVACGTLAIMYLKKPASAVYGPHMLVAKDETSEDVENVEYVDAVDTVEDAETVKTETEVIQEENKEE